MSSLSSEKSPKGLQLKTDLLVGAVIVLAALFLAPILSTPLLGDDAFNSYLTGYMGYHGMGALELMRLYDSRLIAQQGRYIPAFTIQQFVLWTLTQSAVTIKAIHVLTILSDLALFYVFLKKFGRSRSLALWSIAIVLLTFQIRLFYDPYAGIVVVMQVVMGCLLGSFILIIDEIDGKRTVWRIPAAVLLYAVAALTYEIAYLYVAVIFCVAWFRFGSLRPAIKLTLSFVAVFALLVVKDVWLRHNSNLIALTHREYVITFNPVTSFTTWFWQTAAAVPLSYLTLNPKHYLPGFQGTLFRHSGTALAVFLLAIGVGYSIVRASPRDPGRPAETPLWQIIVVGVLLAIIPGALLSVSPRWQSEVVPGLGYLPVYEAGFGIAMLIGAVLLVLLRAGGPVRTIAGLAVPLAFGIVLTVTYQANALTLALYDPVWNWARQNVTQSVKLGLLNSVPADASIFLDTSYPFFYGNANEVPWFIWDSRYLLYMYSDKRVAVYPQADIGAAAPTCTGQRSPCSPTAPAYQLFNVATSYNVGFDALVKIKRITYGNGASVATGDEATIVERGPETGGRPALAARALADSDFTVEAVGADWRRFNVRSSCGPVNADIFANGGLIDVRYGDGFYGAEQNAAETWHWAQPRARMAIVNSIESKQAVTIDFTAEALDPGRSGLRVSYAGKTIAERFAGKPLTFHLSATLAPLATVPIDFSTDAPKPPGIPDPRDLHVRIVNVRATPLSASTHC